MATNGCIGVCIAGVSHFMFNGFDSDPAGLGRQLVEQIANADLTHWRSLARQLSPTQHWDDPDFKLTDEEVQHIVHWAENRLQVEVFVDATPDASSIRVTGPRAEEAVCTSATQFAAILEPALRHKPNTFFDAIAGQLNVILELGLYPRLSPRFLESARCEWIYVVNFDDNQFQIGMPIFDEQKWLANAKIGIWTASDEPASWHQCASFPLDAIPSSWEEKVKENREASDE